MNRLQLAELERELEIRELEVDLLRNLVEVMYETSQNKDE